MRLLWATDVHLDHVRKPHAAHTFGAGLAEAHPEASELVVTGDIAEADCIEHILEDLARGFGRPVSFVLGNHDYYGSNFAQVDATVAKLNERLPGLYWLSQGVRVLAPSTVLVGHEGWYDARLGNPESPLELTDFRRIEDVFAARDDGHASFLSCLRSRADASAKAMERHLLHALEDRAVRSVLVATHVPPFVEASWYRGRTADATWAPFFASRVMGEMLVRIAEQYEHVSLTVLCGHTHGKGTFVARPNLIVHTGAAQYGEPRLCGVVEVDGTTGAIAVREAS
jgi:UDP-2,3-diacylglucosamine pyrophosphatase LpxH